MSTALSTPNRRRGRRVVSARIVGLFGEEHVILAKLTGTGIGIFRRRVVPESQLAFAAQDVGAENAAAVGESGHCFTIHITAGGMPRVRASTRKA